jgi:hypothetical protein
VECAEAACNVEGRSALEISDDDNNYGPITVSSGTFTAIAAGSLQGLGSKSDGTLAGWGSKVNLQATVRQGTGSSGQPRRPYTVVIVFYSWELICGRCPAPFEFKASHSTLLITLLP